MVMFFEDMKKRLNFDFQDHNIKNLKGTGLGNIFSLFETASLVCLFVQG